MTAEQLGGAANKEAHAGGLVGRQGSGGATAGELLLRNRRRRQPIRDHAKSYAGGLVGYLASGNVKASYSHASAEAKTGASITGATLTAGGLVGQLQTGATITASYSTGAPTTSGGSSPTERKGGLAGFNGGGTANNSYWDTGTSGITATGEGTGKTTSELQTPTAYGTQSTDIYKDWNIDVGGTSAT